MIILITTVAIKVLHERRFEHMEMKIFRNSITNDTNTYDHSYFHNMNAKMRHTRLHNWLFKLVTMMMTLDLVNSMRLDENNIFIYDSPEVDVSWRVLNVSIPLTLSTNITITHSGHQVYAEALDNGG